jgi:ketosteroid isomerase-like protein
MIAALLLMAAEPMTAIDAERAFAADAQKLGQWTAFRKYAADDAVMFVPEQVNAQAWLKDKKDPPTAVFWWPGRSYVSCDGTIAVNTGPWVREWDKSVGYFTTVWKRQPDGGWKWLLDHGDAVKTARAEGGDIEPRNASCAGEPTMMPHSGHSGDRTLAWNYDVGPQGQRSVLVWIWTGTKYENVIEDLVKPQTK